MRVAKIDHLGSVEDNKENQPRMVYQEDVRH